VSASRWAHEAPRRGGCRARRRGAPCGGQAGARVGRLRRTGRSGDRGGALAHARGSGTRARRRSRAGQGRAAARGDDARPVRRAAPAQRRRSRAAQARASRGPALAQGQRRRRRRRHADGNASARLPRSSSIAGRTARATSYARRRDEPLEERRSPIRRGNADRFSARFRAGWTAFIHSETMSTARSASGADPSVSRHLSEGVIAHE